MREQVTDSYLARNGFTQLEGKCGADLLLSSRTIWNLRGWFPARMRMFRYEVMGGWDFRKIPFDEGQTLDLRTYAVLRVVVMYGIGLQGAYDLPDSSDS